MKVHLIPLLLLLIAGDVLRLTAESPGTFTATGSMTVPRAGHTATLLPNGKVLITGGVQTNLPNSVLASAELYDPATHTFTATGDMTTMRHEHSATLLPNGKVLIQGGNLTIPTPAELYDPSTGLFTQTGNMTRYGGPATLLLDGKVLLTPDPVVYDPNEKPELYDPFTDKFGFTGALGANPNVVASLHTLLADGRVLMGCDCRFNAPPSIELYDPRTGTFGLTSGTASGPMGWWGKIVTATLLMNGTVLITGADDILSPHATVYDPAAATFNMVGYPATSHASSTAVLLPDGSVLITGGGEGPITVVGELYSSATGTFHPAGNMTAARFLHTSTLLLDGTVLIAGGFSDWPAATSSAEIYTPPVVQAGPVLFYLARDGGPQGAIWNAVTGQVVSPDAPATAGEMLSMYTTSLGEGGVIPPQVAIGGRMAEVLFFGKAPGYPGIDQVNFRVPVRVAAGSAVPVHLTYLGRRSNEVTIVAR